jgi:hypothetical protein
MSLPVRREMRTLRSAGRSAVGATLLDLLDAEADAGRAALPSGSMSMTFETWMGASVVMMPPVLAPAGVLAHLRVLLDRLTPSTMTFFSCRGRPR